MSLKIKLSTPITASNDAANTKALQEITNEDLQEAVRRFMQLDSVTVSHIGTDGYNEDGAGSGAEIHFTGSVNSAVSYGNKVVNLDGVIALGNFVRETNKSVAGLEAELMAGEEGDLVLMLMAD